MDYPITPDGRYFIVREPLWRMTNPALPDETRQRLTKALMAARRAVGVALRKGDGTGLDETDAVADLF